MVIKTSPKRIFLVGCPRSGTTLLQSFLTAHSRITSFPESHFFDYLIPFRKLNRKLSGKLNSDLYTLGLISRKAKLGFEEFIDKIGKPNLSSYLPNNAVFQTQYIEAFIKVLDTVTQEEQKDIWLEKTPGHLRFINYIEKRIQDVQFIHIIRNGEDVVASMYEVTNQYPEIWGGTKSVDSCIRSWKKDVRISLTYKNKPNHVIVLYKDLINNTPSELQKICNFLDISFEEMMLQNYAKSADRIVINRETWKESVGKPIKNTTNQKFFKLFDQKTRERITRQVSKLNIEKEILS